MSPQNLLTRSVQARLKNLYPNDSNLEFARLGLNSHEVRINTKRGMEEVRCGRLSSIESVKCIKIAYG